MQRVLAVLAAAVGSVALALTGAGAAQAAVDLDVLFVGAHPDDEAGGLSTYGAWAEEYGLRTGVITVQGRSACNVSWQSWPRRRGPSRSP